MHFFVNVARSEENKYDKAHENLEYLCGQGQSASVYQAFADEFCHQPSLISDILAFASFPAFKTGMGVRDSPEICVEQQIHISVCQQYQAKRNQGCLDFPKP